MANDRDVVRPRRLRLLRGGALLRDPPARAAAAFAGAGLVWILLTDILLYSLVSDPRTVARLETAKGWAFVLLGALLVYATTSHYFMEVRRSEGVLRAILRSIADGVLLVGSPERRIVEANPAALRMLGVQEESEVVGLGPEEFSRLFILTTPKGKLMSPRLYGWQRALDGELVKAHHAVLYPKSGPPITLSVSAAPVSPSWEQTELAVAVIQDVTQEAQVEHTRQHLFAAAAHALRTPVATIKTHAQVLLVRGHGDVVRAAAVAIDRQSSRLGRLVQNLLVASRMHAGMLELHLENVDLAELVEEVTTEEEVLRGRESVVVDRGPRPQVFADRERLALAVRNLVDAAVLRLPTGAVASVRLEELDHRVRVSVHGARVGGEAFTYDEEIRLGLLVSHEIVEAHGGKDDHTVVPGGAATTWFDLPTLEMRGEAR